MGDDSKTKSERRIEFMVLEYGSSQERIRHASADLYRTETIVPIAIGLIYVWLYRDQAGARPAPQWAWWIPAIIATFGAVRQCLRYRSLWATHLYVQAIEREFYGTPRSANDKRPFGWETHWLGEANRFVQILRWEFSLHGLMRIVFWLLIIAGTTFLAAQETIFV